MARGGVTTDQVATEDAFIGSRVLRIKIFALLSQLFLAWIFSNTVASPCPCISRKGQQRQPGAGAALRTASSEEAPFEGLRARKPPQRRDRWPRQVRL